MAKPCKNGSPTRSYRPTQSQLWPQVHSPNGSEHGSPSRRNRALRPVPLRDQSAIVGSGEAVIRSQEGFMLKEFQEFIAKGNVMDLAVGVIIGGAFGLIVTSIVNDIVMPIVGAILGGGFD